VNDHDQAVLDASLYGGGPVVHLAGPLRPFARCGSYTAAERHTRDLAEVTCMSCMQLMSDDELDGVS
jgi:hypothetical protein